MMRFGFWHMLLLLSMGLSVACVERAEPEPDCQFVQNSQLQRVSWNGNLPIKIYIHSSVPEAYRAGIVRAMANWDEAMGSRPVFEYAGVIEQGQGPAQDLVSAVYWRTTWDTERTREQARTTIYWKGNQIEEADMQINARDFRFSSGLEPQAGAVDFESLIVHELGHVLGLTHNSSEESVMAETLANAHFRRIPSKADLDSLRCEY